MSVDRLLVARAILAVALLGTIVAMVVMWPGEREVATDATARGESIAGEVTGVRVETCPGGIDDDCVLFDVEVLEGDFEGNEYELTFGSSSSPTSPEVGDTVRLYESNLPEEAVGIDGAAPPPVYFADFDRRVPLLILLAIFVAAVLVVSRWQGARSLVGLALSLVLLTAFTIPALLAGASPVVIAIITAVSVMFLTLVLTHGIGPIMISAALGTLVSLAVTITIAWTFAASARLTGLVSEEAVYLQGQDSSISLLGLLLAGIVIAALGVLDDVTVSQASTVAALRSARDQAGVGELIRRGFVVGRDHLAATVNTLVLAYAGSSLAVLLVFAVGDTRFLDAATNETVAAQVIAILSGSLGLLAAMPLTTVIAAWLIKDLPAERLGHHGHVH